MAARAHATATDTDDDDNKGHVLDRSIHRLLGEINQRREEAAQFAQMVEQSIYRTPRARRTTDARSWSAPASDDSFALDGSVINRGADEMSRSASPPASFLEGFTQHFVNTYQAPSDATADALAGRDWRHGLHHSYDESIISDIDPQQPESAPESPQHPESVPVSPQPPVSAPVSPQGAEHRGVAVIDRAARARLWQRVDSSALPGDTEDRDEARIQAIVQLAERIAALQTQAGAASPAAAPANCTQHDISGADDVACWVPGEWEQWARHAREQRVGSERLTSGRMAQRLEWVHEHQPWRHGFSDGLVAGGKLKRTYRDMPLDLQAYPDGNVKRTAAAARHPVSGARCAATTLYFANGDWSCTVTAPCGSSGETAHYYYYSDEAVWHEQHGAASLYRFADGREERTDALGTLTVRYPSGDVRVSLPPIGGGGSCAGRGS
ncbi:hypothetical protein H4R19_002938 [Coemansia spiralis]|nr:hypothetical protein H4R19_002938 [Coemansia spiralis]